MDRHFRDAWYHQERAAVNVKDGIMVYAKPAERKARELAGQEVEPEPTQRERIEQRARQLEEEAEYRIQQALEEVRRRVRPSR